MKTYLSINRFWKNQALHRLLPVWLILLMGGWVANSGTLAQSIVRIDSLQEGQSLFTQAWQYHAGDDIRWADPTFDDRHWLPYKPYFDRDHAPPDWKGIGWFRLHINIDSLPDNQLLALLLDQVSAAEVYVDGMRIGGFGKIGHSAATGTDYVSHNTPLFFRFNQRGHHLLAVRQATFRSYITRWMRYQQGFRIWLTTDAQAVADVLEGNRVWSINLLSIFVAGWFALMHWFLFLYYPARRSNLYYSIWLVVFAGTSACVYADYSVTDPLTLQKLAYSFWLGNVAIGLMAVVFIYSVCYTRFPRLIWGFYTIALLVGIGVAFSQVINSVPWVGIYLILCLLEVMRVVVLATLRRQPGIWLIGIGVLAVGAGIFVGAADVLHIWQNNTWGQTLFLTSCFLTLPLCTSLYLARDFADRLKQVEELSAQTRAQEAEKLNLIASQKEQLEQTVHERTAQLQQQTARLQELDAFKSRFFTNLTHEFRTPLTLILGPAEQLLAQTADLRTKQQVDLIQRNGSRLLRLINQLLDLSKLEAGKLELAKAPADLVRLVRETLFSFESLADQKQIKLRLTTAPERLIMALDRDALEKILINLVSNALKFTLTGGQIVVTLTRDEMDEAAWVKLVVQDTGVGIPVAKLPYIFDRFYQVDASDTREQEGTGIGLALTKELVELHGGFIQIRSQLSVGTTVTVQLPIQQEEPTAQHPEALASLVVSPANSPSQRLNTIPEPITELAPDAPLVLLIDDNDDVRSFILSSLTGQYRIIEASNGTIGVQLAQQQVPDLVITDLMMPKMNGYQVCVTLKGDERTSHIPVIMLTARADLDSKVEGLETGADAYLVKPFTQRELVAHVANLIALRQQLREHYRQLSLQQGNYRLLDYPGLPSMERVFLDRVRAAISNHLSDEQYSVELLSDEVGLSRAQLHRKLKALTNQSPGDLIRLIRLQRAHELLSASVGTVSEVAYMVGFGNPANFSTSFSRQFGYPPSDVKNR